jgi:hypothetical protein
MVNTGLFVVLNFVVQSAVSTAGAANTITPASTASLIAILPLVGAVVGGIVGAWANSWYRNRETKKARKQELEGLMILLGTEVRTNDIALRNFLESTSAQPDSDKRALVGLVHNVVWDESRARLAQLLPRTTEIAKVAVYYIALAELRTTSTGLRGKCLKTKQKQSAA